MTKWRSTVGGGLDNTLDYLTDADDSWVRRVLETNQRRPNSKFKRADILIYSLAGFATRLETHPERVYRQFSLAKAHRRFWDLSVEYTEGWVRSTLDDITLASN